MRDAFIGSVVEVSANELLCGVQVAWNVDVVHWNLNNARAHGHTLQNKGLQQQCPTRLVVPDFRRDRRLTDWRREDGPENSDSIGAQYQKNPFKGRSVLMDSDVDQSIVLDNEIPLLMTRCG